jgi:hypothetical protein
MAKSTRQFYKAFLAFEERNLCRQLVKIANEEIGNRRTRRAASAVARKQKSN